jgi:hypothetical protein
MRRCANSCVYYQGIKASVTTSRRVAVAVRLHVTCRTCYGESRISRWIHTHTHTHTHAILVNHTLRNRQQFNYQIVVQRDEVICHFDFVL